MLALSRDEILRYSRHLIMPEVTAQGQAKLKSARVLCVGAGGLGSPLTLYLAAAGVGTLGVADFDTVDLTNLQRQVLYSTADVGRPKVVAAGERLAALNPGIEIVPHAVRLTSANVMDIVRDYDVVADGSDNFPTRYLVNDACVVLKKPLVSGAILRFEGHVTTILPGEGHCYRCLFEEMPPEGFVQTCSEAGIIGAIPGVIGSLQAVEVIKIILGKGKVLKNTLLVYDALNASFRRVTVPKNPECPACGADNALLERDEYRQHHCTLAHN